MRPLSLSIFAIVPLTYALSFLCRSLTAEQRGLIEAYADTVKSNGKSAYSSSKSPTGYSPSPSPSSPGPSSPSSSSSSKTKSTGASGSGSSFSPSSASGSTMDEKDGKSSFAGKAFGWLADKLEGGKK